MALSSNIVWEVRSAGSNNNGGGFKTGASGTDYTQQNSAQYALTGCTSSGAGAVILTASAAADMVGNVAQVISGTNFTAGFYEITSVSVGVSITVDANCTTGAGSSGVVNIGGALATIGKIGSASANQGAVAGNLICVKSGSYTLTATDTIACSGTSTLPIRIIGYNSTRPTATTSGDGYLGRTNSNGPLITTNMPAYAYNATFRLNATGTFISIESIVFSVAGAGVSNYVVTLAADSTIRACSVTNPSTNSASAGVFASSNRNAVIDCDVFVTGATGGTTGIHSTATGGRVIGCRVKTSSASAPGITVAGSTIVMGCTVYGCPGIGISINSTGSACAIVGNTIVGNSGDGIDVITGTTGLQFIGNNMITDNGGYGIDFNSTAVGGVLFNNRFRDNTSGNINSGTGWADATSWNHVTTDTGNYTTDYADYSSNDYRLIAASPAAGAGIPVPASIGALQRSATGGGLMRPPGMNAGMNG